MEQQTLEGTAREKKELLRLKKQQGLLQLYEILTFFFQIIETQHLGAVWVHDTLHVDYLCVGEFLPHSAYRHVLSNLDVS